MKHGTQVRVLIDDSPAFGVVTESHETFAWVLVKGHGQEYAVYYADLEIISWTHNQSSTSPAPSSE
jgi:hypothetical protein